MPYQTLSQLKTQLALAGTTDDGLLEQLQASAEAFISTHCQRKFTDGTFTEYHRSGTRYLFLENYPIQQVTSIHIDPSRTFGAETLLDVSQYVVIPRSGLVEALNWSFLRKSHPEAIKVVYSATATMPAEVLRAEAELVSHWYRQIKTHGDSQHLNILTRTDGTAVTELPWGQAGGFRIPAGVLQLLKYHRLPAIG